MVMAGTTAIRYRDIGKGEKVILLLHGYLHSLEVWDDFAGQLGKSHRVIAFDIPGHGISEVMGEVHTMEFIADTAKALLDKIGVEKVNIVGHSMGGYIALAFGAKYGDMVESLTLFHSHPDVDTPEKAADREREIEIIKSGRKELLTTVAPSRIFAPDNQRRYRDLIDELSQQAMLTEDEGIIALLRGMAQKSDMNDMLRAASFKQLFVFGAHDSMLPRERAEKIIANHPQAKSVILENSGHIAFVEEFDKSLELIMELV